MSHINLDHPIYQLAQQLRGQLVLAGDADYDALRAKFSLLAQQHPAAIIVAQDTADISLAVQFANKHDMGISVTGAGHNMYSPADDDLLIITRHLDLLDIDAGAQTAVIGAGLRWNDVLQAAQAVGLAPLLGSSPLVGVVGYTLGGGMGWLARKYGLALDSVIYFELVLPNGRLVRASASENSDLFWALRGGGGNFGIITSVKMRLYPVTTVYAGNLYYPVEMAREVITRYREWIKTAPDELTSAVNITNYPPLPQMPEAIRGKSFVIVRGCYCGDDLTEGERLLAYWRDWQAPAMDAFGAMPFSDAATISNDPVDPAPFFSTGAWLHDINDDVVEAMVTQAPAAAHGLPIIMTEIRHAGGAMAQVKADANAYSHRHAAHSLQIIALVPEHDMEPVVVAQTEAIKQGMQSALTGGVYLNFLEGAEGRRRTPDGFSAAHLQRLERMKMRFDPDNRLRHSFALIP